MDWIALYNLTKDNINEQWTYFKNVWSEKFNFFFLLTNKKGTKIKKCTNCNKIKKM